MAERGNTEYRIPLGGFAGGGGSVGVPPWKAAATSASAFIVRSQAARPEQAPLHPANVAPLSATASRWAAPADGNTRRQSVAQSDPPARTVPLPVTVMCRVRCGAATDPLPASPPQATTSKHEAAPTMLFMLLSTLFTRAWPHAMLGARTPIARLRKAARQVSAGARRAIRRGRSRTGRAARLDRERRRRPSRRARRRRR